MKRLFLLISVLLVACSSKPSQDAIQTAIAETSVAEVPAPQVASTQTPSPTVTVESTNTATAKPTSTSTVEPTATFAPSPTPDTRIIIGDAEDYILPKNDLLDKYILRPGDSTPHLSEEILSARGAEEGKAYLEETGRIKGWIIWYNLASPTAIAPEWIRSYIVMYKTAEGPALAMGPKWNKDFFDKIAQGELERVDMKLDLGDENIVYFERKRLSSGQYQVTYYIEFRYRNVWAEILGEGLEPNVRHDYLENLARIILKKLQAAPLSSP